MRLGAIVITQEQIRGLEQLCSIVMGEFDRSGRLIRGNAGLHRITAAKSASLRELISQPQHEILMDAVPDRDGRLHFGLITARGVNDTMISLTGLPQR